jgi:hypothetical protein
MCMYADVEDAQSKRLRQRAAALAALAGTLAISPALSLTHGHHVVTWIVVACQLALLTGSGALLGRSKRLAARRNREAALRPPL